MPPASALFSNMFGSMPFNNILNMKEPVLHRLFVLKRFMKKLTVNGIEFSLTRKKIKNINLRIKGPEGKVEVSAPLLCPEAVIIRFVQSRTDWILKKQKETIRRSEDLMRDPTAEDILQLKARISPVISYWEVRTGLHPTQWKLRKMKSVWGTCNTKTGVITFNSHLAYKSDEFLSYVILHEMAHLKEASHGEKFKSILDHYMPEWRSIRKNQL